MDNDIILKNLNASLKSRKLYQAGHPAVTAPVRKTASLLTEALREKNNIAMAVVHDSIVFEDTLLEDSEKLYPEMLKYLADKNVDTVIFERGVGEKELSSLFDVLTGPTIQGSDLQKELHSKGIVHVTLKSMPVGKRKIIEIYNGAVEVVKGTMHEVRMGKIPRSEPVNNIVDEMTETIFSDPNAIIGLTMIKNYDNYLYNHCVNVSIMSLSLARELNLGKEEAHAVGVAALLHDVGKTGVAEDIIRKPGGLSSEEWEKVKEHPLLGSNIIKRMDGMSELVGYLVYEHHIKYDRTGYPSTDIVIHPYSQIITICDAYDALTTLRVYQKPHNPVEAIRVMTSLSGRHFDPDVLKAFINMLGLYPIGTMVRLSTNEIALVTKENPQTPDRPVVTIVFDIDGKALDSPTDENLAIEESRGKTIIATVNPATLDIDIESFFEKAAG